jgi:hypothetical protein
MVENKNVSDFNSNFINNDNFLFTLTKKHFITISLIVFCSFLVLLILASIFDLKLSQLIAEPSLVKNQYYTSNLFANAFEILGSLPLSLMVSISLMCLVFGVK